MARYLSTNVGAQEFLFLDFVCARHLKQQLKFCIKLSVLRSEIFQNWHLFRAQRAKRRIQYMGNIKKGAIIITGESQDWTILTLFASCLQLFSSPKRLSLCICGCKCVLRSGKGLSEHLNASATHSTVPK